MPKRSARQRLDRLEELMGLLKDREFATARELADELGVSLSSLNRDLAVLRRQGLPIDSDRGRGGGLRLDRSWHRGRLHLRAEEAVDLMVSLAVAEQMKSPLLLRHLASLRRKVAASFGPDDQERIRLIRRRVFVGGSASGAVIAGYAPPTRASMASISEAFFNLHCLEISYVDQKGVATTREIEPHFLYCNAPVWYLLAFDCLRRAVRFFRIDRITSARVLSRRFRPARPEPYLAAAERGVISA